MDPSSAIRPEASTVHRPASTDPVLAGEKQVPALVSDREVSDREVSEREVSERELEAAETVIRQDPLGAFATGSSRRDVSGSRGEASFPGSSKGSSHNGPSLGSGSGSLPGPTHHTPASLTRELAGQRLNHFELLDQIGGGGMGAVFRAVDERLGRTVAVKVVPFAAGDPDLQRRFRNEAQSAAKLDHPLIARVFEVGNDGPWYYIVFEYIDGSNIRDIVSQSGPLSLDDAVFYTCQVAEAIGHASRRGIVHRDIKPSNVVVTEERSIKLVDMGLARSESFETSEDMTASGVTLGTFDYISPEQAHDPRLADIRSDLYSLGCTFYYMLTGVPPYPGGTMLQKLLNHGNAAIPDVRDRRDNASDDLAAILRKMLAKQPDQRYQNSQALIADLRELAMRENLRRSRGVDVVTVDGDSVLLRKLLRHLPWVVAATVLMGTAVGLELLSWQQRGDFSAQVAATIPETAMESLPVNALNPMNEEERPLMGSPFSARRNPSPKTPGMSDFNVSVDAENPSSSTDRNRSSTDAGGDDVVIAGAVDMLDDTVNSSSRGPNLADSDESPSAMLDDGLPGFRLDPSVAGSSGGNSVANPENPSSNSVASSSLPAVTSTSRPGDMNRLASDPPSLQNFPFPIGSDSAPEENPNERLILPRVPSFADENRLNPPAGMDFDAERFDGTSVTLDPIDRNALADPPHTVRIVSDETLLGATTIEDARSEGVVLTTSLADALELAHRHRVERIDIDTPMLVSDPVVIEEDDLVIASTVPGGTAIVFNSSREIDMQRSDMLMIGTNRIELVDMHLYWTVPVSETDGGSMIAMNDNRRVRLTDCSITIDNPTRRENIHAFNIVTDPETIVMRIPGMPRTGSSLADPLPLVSLELYNVIIRGQISMLQMDVAAELQLLWENGLLAVSRRMIETGGSLQRPQPMSGSIRLSLQRLTAYVPRGLVLMRLGVSTPHPVSIEREAEESVFVVDRGAPHVEISGVSREDRDLSWLRIRGASNAYEADTTLSDPMLVVRDQSGQKSTTTMDDLIEKKPDWADERTPRWVVRWSQSLPDSVPVSRLIPADFRQDGSLFAGFQEKSLPKMPMQRTLEFAAPDTN